MLGWQDAIYDEALAMSLEEVPGPHPTIEMLECVRRFASSLEMRHTCPDACERCAFEMIGTMLLQRWEQERG